LVADQLRLDRLDLGLIQQSLLRGIQTPSHYITVRVEATVLSLLERFIRHCSNGVIIATTDIQGLVVMADHEVLYSGAGTGQHLLLLRGRGCGLNLMVLRPAEALIVRSLHSLGKLIDVLSCIRCSQNHRLSLWRLSVLALFAPTPTSHALHVT
jgi:hypothetical protein